MSTGSIDYMFDNALHAKKFTKSIEKYDFLIVNEIKDFDDSVMVYISNIPNKRFMDMLENEFQKSIGLV